MTGELDFAGSVAWVARIMEGAGVLSMLAGIFVAGTFSVVRARKRGESAFRTFRQTLGRAILLGLEFLVGADIIRTVSEVPTLDRVVVLAVIVAIRTFLSFTLEVELEGRWPWGRHPRHETRPRPSEPLEPSDAVPRP